MLALLFCIASTLSAGGSKDDKNNQAQEKNAAVIQVSGRVRLVGSEPFPDLIISGPDKDWYIAKDEENKLKHLQQRTVTVEGTETVHTLYFANKRPAGERRTLRNIKVIAVN